MTRYSTPNWSQVNVDDRAGMYALAQSADMLSKGFKDIGSVGNNYQEASKANALLERDKRSLALANQLRNVEGVDQARAAIAGIDPEGWYDTAIINTASEQGLKRGIDLTTSKNTAEALGKIQGAQNADALSKALEFMSQAGPYIDTNTTGAAVRGQNNLFESQFTRQENKLQSDRDFSLKSQEAALRRQDQVFNRQLKAIELRNNLVNTEMSQLTTSLGSINKLSLIADAESGDPAAVEKLQKYQNAENRLNQLENEKKSLNLSTVSLFENFGVKIPSMNTAGVVQNSVPASVAQPTNNQGTSFLTNPEVNTANVSNVTNTGSNNSVVSTPAVQATVPVTTSIPVDQRQMLRDQAGSFGEAGMPITSSGALKVTPAGFVDERLVVNPNVQQNAVQRSTNAYNPNPPSIGRSNVVENFDNKLTAKPYAFNKSTPELYLADMVDVEASRMNAPDLAKQLRQELVTVRGNTTLNAEPNVRQNIGTLNQQAYGVDSSIKAIEEKAKLNLINSTMQSLDIPIGSERYTSTYQALSKDPEIMSQVQRQLTLDPDYNTAQALKTQINYSLNQQKNIVEERSKLDPKFYDKLDTALEMYLNSVGSSNSSFELSPLVLAAAKLVQTDPLLGKIIVGDTPTADSLQNRSLRDYTELTKAATKYVKNDPERRAILDSAISKFKEQNRDEKEVNINSAAVLMESIAKAVGTLE